MNQPPKQDPLSPSQDLVSQAMLDGMPFGVLVTDDRLNLVQVNRWVLEHTRLDPGQALGAPLAEVFPEIGERRILEAYQKVLQGGGPLRLSYVTREYYLRLSQPGEGSGQLMPHSTEISPLLVEGQPVGTLTVVSDMSSLVQAEQALQKEVERLEALQEIDHALATLDFDRCLNIIVERTCDIFQADAVSLILEESGGLVIAASQPSKTITPIAKGLAEWVMLHRQAVLVEDTLQDGRFEPQIHQNRTDMAAPLVLQDACIGVLDVQSLQTRAYSPGDLDILGMLAGRAAAAIHNARLHTAEREQRQMAETLREISLRLSHELDPETVLDTVLALIARVIPYDSANVILVENGRLRVRRLRGYTPERAVAALMLEIGLSEYPILRRIAETGLPDVVKNTAIDPRWVNTPTSSNTGSWAGAPIIVRDRLVGFISVDKVEPNFYTRELADVLAAFAAHTGIALENARLYAEQQRLAVTDGLTGLANRRRFDEMLEIEFERMTRYRRNLAMVMLDIDNFKDYNDTYGHPAGDHVLRRMAVLLRRSVRSIDVAARYGGEEFCVLLPETDLTRAAQVAERLRLAVEKMHQAPAELGLPAIEHRITISLGVAVAPEHAGTTQELVRQADGAMYRAKRGGKNRVVTCTPVS